VREELVQPGLGRKYAAGCQRPRHLTERIRGPGKVEARAEIDDQIEGVVREGELADIGRDQLGSCSGGPEALTGLVQEG
jgi:hypothetical protein